MGTIRMSNILFGILIDNLHNASPMMDVASCVC